MVRAALQNIPTDLLRSFVSAIDTGSFTRAAETVGRTQSAVSLQIRRLEDVVGTRLFVRDAHKLMLTDEGKTLAQYAVRMLALNDEALAVLNSPKISGRVRLGAPHEYTASLLPEFLGRFAQSHPQIMLEVTSDLTKNLLQRQQNGEFDLVVALHDAESVGGEWIHTEPLVWFTSLDHDRQRESPLPLVLAPQPCIYRARILKTMKSLGQPARITYLSSSYDAILAAVRAGLGVTAMARSTIPSDMKLLSEGDGLPDLGHLELRLHRTPGSTPGRAIEYLQGRIAERFGIAVPTLAD